MATRKAKRTKAAAKKKATKKAPARRPARAAVPKKKATKKAPARRSVRAASPKKKAAKKKSTTKAPARKAKRSTRRSPPPRPLLQVLPEVDEYLAKNVRPPWKAVMAEVHATVKTACPDAEDAIHLGFPIFSCCGLVAWMRAYPDCVSLGFWRGAELNDPDGLLEDLGGGRKRIRLAHPEDVPISKIDALVRQACALNKEKGDPTAGHEVVEDELV